MKIAKYFCGSLFNVGVIRRVCGKLLFELF